MLGSTPSWEVMVMLPADVVLEEVLEGALDAIGIHIFSTARQRTLCNNNFKAPKLHR